jgi:hypothetical protein
MKVVHTATNQSRHSNGYERNNSPVEGGDFWTVRLAKINRPWGGEQQSRVAAVAKRSWAQSGRLQSKKSEVSSEAFDLCGIIIARS